MREVQATGFLEQEGITCVSSCQLSVQAGGLFERESSYVSNKVVLGDKWGNLTLLDAGRKIVLDKKAIFEGRRI